MEHHLNINGNYFPDICDLIFNTKHNPSDVENTDHWLPNIVAVTLIVLFTKQFYRNFKDKKSLNLFCFIIYGIMYDSIILFSIYYYIKDIFKNDKINEKNFNDNILFIKHKLNNSI